MRSRLPQNFSLLRDVPMYVVPLDVAGAAKSAGDGTWPIWLAGLGHMGQTFGGQDTIPFGRCSWPAVWPIREPARSWDLPGGPAGAGDSTPRTPVFITACARTRLSDLHFPHTHATAPPSSRVWRGLGARSSPLITKLPLGENYSSYGHSHSRA